MPTRPHPRARTLSIAAAAGVAATVAALAAFPYVLEGFLREGGSVGGMRWSAPGAEFSWPFHFKADSVVVEGEGRRIAVDAPEIRLDPDPFGESLVAVSARKAVVVLPPGDSPAPAEDQVQSPESAATPEVPADPTEGEVWLKGYYFERNGVRIDALVGTKGAAFYCRFNGRDTGIGQMLYDHHFRFYNSDGIELTKEQAEKISSRIKDHDEFEADH